VTDFTATANDRSLSEKHSIVRFRAEDRVRIKYTGLRNAQRRIHLSPVCHTRNLARISQPTGVP